MVIQYQKNDQPTSIRPTRIISHSFVEVRRFKHLPIFCKSGVLLDISSAGFKIELTGDSGMKPGDRFWLRIHLKSLGIYSPTELYCKCECRWFDVKKYRAGGVFMQLSKQNNLVIEQVINTLVKRASKTSKAS